MGVERIHKLLSCSFEREFVTLTASGTMAIVVALESLSLPSQSGVVIPSICCPAVLSAIQIAGHRPVIADVDAKTICMGVKEIAAVLDDNCRAILAVHAYGRPCEMGLIQDFCHRRNLVLIEDACLSYGNVMKEGPVGAFGDLSLISFGYDKPIDCGGGGALMTNDKCLAKQMASLVRSNPIMAMRDNHVGVLMDLFPRLPETVLKRIANTEKYGECITTPGVMLPDLGYGYWRLPLLVDGMRDEIIQKAKTEEITITSHYRSLSGFSHSAFTPVADRIDATILNAFTHPQMEEQHIIRLSRFLNEFDYG